MFLLFFLSPDSYLYDVFYRGDSAIFYTSGKAWMNGMVPYVDFADSKGPLLWLIYGIGYLLNSHSYVGVFWISCCFYAVTFMFAYRLCRLYVDRRVSAIVMAFLPLFLLNKHKDDVQAEDFCYTFLFISLYCLCRVLQGVDKRKIFKYAFAVGCSMSCLLLIKWNYFFLLGSVALVVLFVSLRQKTLYGLWGGLSGIIVPLIPFLVYFIVQGNLDAFISEYFLNTSATVSIIADDLGTTVINGLVGRWKMRVLILIGVVLFCCRHKGNWGILFVLALFNIFLISAILVHYYMVVLPFSIFLLIAVLDYLQGTGWLRKPVATILAFMGVIVSVLVNVPAERIRGYSVFANNEYRQSYYDVSKLMATVEKPKVLFYNMDPGIGVLADALPVCRYWTLQAGAPDFMAVERGRILHARKADFVFVLNKGCDGHYVDVNKMSEVLNGLNYVYCGEVYGSMINWSMLAYCKKELYRKLPPVKLRTIDLLLKRDILCGKSEGK